MEGVVSRGGDGPSTGMPRRRATRAQALPQGRRSTPTRQRRRSFRTWLLQGRGLLKGAGAQASRAVWCALLLATAGAEAWREAVRGAAGSSRAPPFPALARPAHLSVHGKQPWLADGAAARPGGAARAATSNQAWLGLSKRAAGPCTRQSSACDVPQTRQLVARQPGAWLWLSPRCRPRCRRSGQHRAAKAGRSLTPACHQVSASMGIDSDLFLFDASSHDRQACSGEELVPWKRLQGARANWMHGS